MPPDEAGWGRILGGVDISDRPASVERMLNHAVVRAVANKTNALMGEAIVLS